MDVVQHKTIKQAREAKGWSEAELAVAAGVNVRIVHLSETCVGRVQLADVLSLVEVLEDFEEDRWRLMAGALAEHRARRDRVEEIAI